MSIVAISGDKEWNGWRFKRLFIHATWANNHPD